ncbi:MAG: signal peptidase II [Planctomycetes bacterium]|nr:signal peptidase II [Planctomycetota bacterium]
MAEAPQASEPTAAVPATAAAPAVERGFAGKLWFFCTWPPLVALDLWSKHVVFAFLDGVANERGEAHLPEGHRTPWNVFDGSLLQFDLVTWGNPGTIWGLFQGSTVPLMVVRCCAVVALVWFLRNTARAAKVQQGVIALVLAGALGNLYDNFVRADRSVRDFLYFTGEWPVAWTFPAFNVADSCITVGAIGLFLLLWRDDRKPKQAPVSS